MQQTFRQRKKELEKDGLKGTITVYSVLSTVRDRSLTACPSSKSLERDEADVCPRGLLAINQELEVVAQVTVENETRGYNKSRAASCK